MLTVRKRRIPLGAQKDKIKRGKMITTLTSVEKVMYSLRTLYESYGYSQYKMSKFEEYDLYVRNKSFLQSDNIITFTDKDGKLMALKPDVTLSIVKNSDAHVKGLRRVYYNENVYRVPRGGLSYKEIMQSGLECIGELDTYAIVQVLTIAAHSLETISNDFVLDISDLGIISELIDSMGVDGDGKSRLILALGEKNIHEADAICREYSVAGENAERLKALMSMSTDSTQMLEILKGSEAYGTAKEFAEIIDVLTEIFGARVRIDFSVVDDTRYYNGIVFKGFVKGIPTSVLSGGRYDTLMERMGKKSGAIGFAVYLDLLDGIGESAEKYDCDAFILYGDETPIKTVSQRVERLVQSGKRVQSGRAVPENMKCKEIINV